MPFRVRQSHGRRGRPLSRFADHGSLSQGRGQTLAEFAVILLVLMLIVMGIVDFGRAVYARSVIASAAREGARYAVVHPAASTDEIRAQALRLVAGLSGPVTVELGVSGHSDVVQVDVSYVFHPVTLLIGRALDGGSGSGITLRASSRMFLEGE